MANSGYSSPFHTLHDTIGASTLITPLVMPSSPPSPARDEDPGTPDTPVAKNPTPHRVAQNTRRDNVFDEEDEDDKYDVRQREFDSPVLSRASSPDHSAMDIDARLADYSIDFSQFPGTTLGADGEDDLLPDMKAAETEKLSDVGGPEDFTANLERYLMGEDDDVEAPLRHQIEKDLEASIRREQQREFDQNDDQEEENEEEEEDELEQVEQIKSRQHHHPPADNDPELGEYSEFGPPVDMSTPSHFLRRSTSGQVTHLEDIEEDDNEIDEAATPSKVLSTKGDEKDPHRQIAELQNAVRDRDEQIQKNHNQVLEAASAREQIKHLQAELQGKTVLLEGSRNEQNHEKKNSPRNSPKGATDVSALQRQMAEMQKELQNRNSHPDLDAERLDTIAHLRQQLNSIQEQLKKRDATLDESMSRLREVATAKEQQLQEKNTEIDRLKAQTDDQALEIEKLETDIDQANTDYQTLEGRISFLETKNGPLEEKNTTLEADLTRAQSQMTAQENALKAMAADLPTATGGQKTFAEILDLIKDLGPPSPTEEPGLCPAPGAVKEDETERLRQELAKLQADLNVRSQIQRTLEAELARAREQTSEAQSLFKSVEDENTRLTKRAEESKSNVDQGQRELNQLRADHSAALQTIARLQDEKKTIQQPSPPPSPPTTTQKNTATSQQQRSSKTNPTRATQQDLNQSSPHHLLAQAEKRESLLRTELHSLRTSRTTQDAQLHSLSTEIQFLKATITAKDETAVALDSRFARSVEKREKEWERRVEMLLKERERMSRALMWTWGEKEVGEKSKENVYAEDGRKLKQGYRYKYATAFASGHRSGKKTASS